MGMLNDPKKEPALGAGWGSNSRSSLQGTDGFKIEKETAPTETELKETLSALRSLLAGGSLPSNHTIPRHIIAPHFPMK
jgi:hypothetical protein